MIYDNIKSEIKEAMKYKNNVKRDCLKSVLGKARDIAKNELKNYDSDIIPDDIMNKAVNKEAKQLNQTIAALKGHEDTDLYITSKNQIDILNAYMPKQMTKDEVESAVSNILSGGEYNNFGEKMKKVMAELRGKADSKLIKEAVENWH